MKPLKKNQKLRLKPIDLSSSAMAVYKVEDFPIFVKDSLPQEDTEIIVTKVLNRFGFGRAIQRYSDHPQRVQPDCPLYPQCGGCQMMHMSYEYQLDFKQQRVQDALRRNGDLNHEVLPTIPAPDAWRYRNKVMIPVQHEPLRAGFYRTNSHDIVDMHECLIQSRQLNEIYQEIKAFIQENNLTQVATIILREGFYTQEVMVALSLTRREEDFKDAFIKSLSGFKNIKSIQLTYNLKQTNVPIGQEHKVIFGSPTITESILGIDYQISLNSFFQINSAQTEHLYSKVLELAQIKPTDKVLDLYCGVGTMSMLFAKGANTVVGVDIVKQAIEDAKENARLNNIENIDFVAMDATKFVNDTNEEFDVLVVDPPRKGLSEQGIKDIITIAPKRMVYVSCNPDTLARDLKLLSSTFNIELIQPLDMFPQTTHVETVVLITRVEK